MDLELASLWHEWGDWLARRKQIPPSARWQSFGALTGRGWGKTLTVSRHVQREVQAGRARRIALVAQSIEDAIDILVLGESGLIATSPPWHKAEYVGGRVVWPCGSQAFIYSASAPGGLRGPEHHLAWASELVAWQASTREEAFSNLELGLRLGYGRLLWDSTPKRRHPLIRSLLQRAEDFPAEHIVVRGSMFENAANLSRGMPEAMRRQLAGSQRGREELEGEFLDDDDGALFRQAWIDAHRRHMPERFVRRIWSVDPAITSRAGSDLTGLVQLGLGPDGQVYVLEDRSGVYPAGRWTEPILDSYFRDGCDLVVGEENRGGDLIAALLSAACRERGLQLVQLDPKAKSRCTPGTVYLRTVHARKAKESRHEPVARLYEDGRVSHVIGRDLSALEDEQCTWVPGASGSPDRTDAMCQGVLELAALLTVRPNPEAQMQVIDAAVRMQRELARPARSPGLPVGPVPGIVYGGPRRSI